MSDETDDCGECWPGWSADAGADIRRRSGSGLVRRRRDAGERAQAGS